MGPLAHTPYLAPVLSQADQSPAETYMQTQVGPTLRALHICHQIPSSRLLRTVTV